jgi:hypothetical protein
MALAALYCGRLLCSQLAGTTLIPAFRWAMGAGCIWFAWCLGLWFMLLSHESRWHGPLDRLAYIAAVLSLCPPMMVLGARRPTNRAWTGFVILPMIVVLCWPVVTMAMHGAWERRLELETPHRIAYLLVLVMSYGNYIGGRLTFPALLSGSALAMIVFTTSQQDASAEQMLAVILLSVGVLIGLRRLQTALWPADRFDRVWQEFSTLFGLVWSRRLLDRINAIAVKQQWPGRLHADGFHWDHAADDATQRQVEHALRWLLRRFVDPEWLDARLGHAATPEENERLSIDT